MRNSVTGTVIATVIAPAFMAAIVFALGTKSGIPGNSVGCKTREDVSSASAPGPPLLVTAVGVVWPILVLRIIGASARVKPTLSCHLTRTQPQL
jgi:hypothetical protein